LHSDETEERYDVLFLFSDHFNIFIGTTGGAFAQDFQKGLAAAEKEDCKMSQRLAWPRPLLGTLSLMTCIRYLVLVIAIALAASGFLASPGLTDTWVHKKASTETISDILIVFTGKFSDGCWTNYDETSRLAEDRLEKSGFSLVQGHEPYGAELTISVHSERSRDGCFGSISLSVTVFDRFTEDFGFSSMILGFVDVHLN